MINEKDRAWIEIDLDALSENFKAVKSRISENTKVMCIVKADAYGHGYEETVKELKACGADAFGVATADEAIQIRKLGITEDILILGNTEKGDVPDLVQHNITAAVFDYDTAKEISKEAAKQGKTAKIHIKIDTGMFRIGYLVTEKSADEIVKISKLGNVFIEGMFSHFSKADETDKSYSKMQFERFLKMDEMLKSRGLHIPLKHIANSATIIDMPEYQLDMVRAGIILYGYYPSNEVDKTKLPLKTVMSIKAHVSRLKTADKGDKISYGGVYTAKGGEVIATVSIGYADGYTRLFSGKVNMIVKGKYVPVVGKICMDQCMINVSSVNNIKEGDEVTVMGKEGGAELTADYLAERIGTISYEILCMTGKRMAKAYKRGNKTVKILKLLEKW